MHYPSLELKTIAPTELPSLISAIENLMRDVERLTKETADEHLRAFAAQMRDKFGADEIAVDEPFLPKTLAFRSIKFLVALERLIKKLEKGSEDEDYRTSIFDFDEPVMPQLNARLELETVRHQLATKQELDKTRQQGFGVKKFIWHASSDACPICAPLDGLIFSWEDGTAPGETHPNCQCWSEPLPDDGPNDPPIEPVYPLETLLAILIGARTAWKIAQEIIRKTEEPAPTQQPKPQEKPPEKPQQTTPQNKPQMDDTKTWPKPPRDGRLKEGTPSRSKPAGRGEKSLYDEKGGEWRYAPEDKYHNEHWDYKPPGGQWENVPIGDKPPIK